MLCSLVLWHQLIGLLRSPQCHALINNPNHILSFLSLSASNNDLLLLPNVSLSGTLLLRCGRPEKWSWQTQLFLPQVGAAGGRRQRPACPLLVGAAGLGSGWREADSLTALSSVCASISQPGSAEKWLGCEKE